MPSILWKDHSVQMLRLISEILKNSELTDCVLDTQGGFIHGHMLILAACSPYMKKMFKDRKGMKIIPFKQVSYNNMKHILNFIYYGNIDIRVTDMASLIETAELLQILSLRCALLNFSEMLSIKDRSKESVSNSGTVSGLHCMKNHERNIEGKGTVALPDRELEMNSFCRNSNLQSYPKAKAIRLTDDLSPMVNKDERMASVPYAKKVEMDVMNDQVHFQDELMPFTFVAVSPVSVKYEEVHDDESSPCNIDPLLNNVLKDYPPDFDLTNVINVKRETDCGSAAAIKTEIERENVSKSDVRISEKVPVIKKEENIPEPKIVSLSGERKSSCDLMSGTVDDNAVVAKNYEGDRQSDQNESFDSNTIPVNTVIKSLNSSKEVEIKFESICDVTETGFEEEYPLGPCQDIKSEEDDGNDLNLLTEDRNVVKCGVNQLEYQFEEFNEPSDAMEICQDPVSNISCGWRKSQIKHIQQEREAASKPLNCAQSDAPIVSDLKCNVGHASHLQDLKGSTEKTLTFDDLFAEQEEALLNHKKRFRKEMGIHTRAEPFNESSSEEGDLVSHMRTHTAERRFKCVACNTSFSRRNDLVCHMRTYTGEKPFKCATCSASFTHRRNLVIHIRIHTGEKPFVCVTCSASFSHKQNLVIHTRIHTGEKPFKCVTCNAVFRAKKSLAEHTRTHFGELPFKCVTCDASFSRRSNLLRHTRTHTGEKPFTCVICNSSFSHKCNLVIHMRIHTGEKPYKCVTCDASFRIKNALASHMRTHTGIKPFKCDTCNTSFSRRSNLVRHTRTHTGEKTF